MRTSSSQYGAFYGGGQSGVSGEGGGAPGRGASPAPAPVPAPKPRIGEPHPLITTSHAKQVNKAVADFWKVAKSGACHAKALPLALLCKHFTKC